MKLDLRKGERILLLQGPMGNFFTRFARYLRAQGAKVSKINFNGGDWLFYPSGDNYRGTVEDWPTYLRDYLARNKIERIYLFGDCRCYHAEACKIAKESGVRVFVFEEGYIRPNYITLEEGGVNGHSSLPRDPDFYRAHIGTLTEPPTQPANTSFWRMSRCAMIYYLAGTLLRPVFWNYKHHKSFSVLRKSKRWLYSGFRKLRYMHKDRAFTHRLATEFSGNYYLVPLQVYNDFQVTRHSQYADVRDFIREVVASFARHAPKDTRLVFKHHPMDRGVRHYGRLLRELADAYSVAVRVHYTHEIHLPTALDHTRGVVVINSTVGFSALWHGAPVKTMGDAIYDMPGLTCRGGLDDFWMNPEKPDPLLCGIYRAFVIVATQINGSYYGKDPFELRAKVVESKTALPK